jgi:membrane-associated protein
MHDFIQLIQSNIELAPWLIFGLMLLAGFNIPVPEDGMIFVSGLLASKYPEKKMALFMGIFWGAYLSDLICYWLGRKLGPALWRIRFFSKMIAPEKVQTMSRYYERFGFFTLLVGRFIPFGVRNALFLTAGLSKMNFKKFASADFIACLTSVGVFFHLYMWYGELVIYYVKKANVVLFAMAIIFVVFLLFKKRKKSLA